MKNLWKDLVSKYSNDLDLIEHFYGIIEKKYSSSNRHYHNLNHINIMLSEVKRFENRINDYDSVSLAIWFHDIIYNPQRGDNEERSVEYAKEFLVKINYEKSRIHKIEELILRTKNHTNQNGNENYDFKVFLDLDLLILGMEKERYIKYAKNIRKEYVFVPDEVYFRERKKILNQFLNSHNIYMTK